LKNKNKSKVVQKFVDDVTTNAKRAGLSKDEAVRLEKMRAEREQTKAEKKERELEMLKLFQPALTKKQKEEKAAKEAAAKAAAAKAKESEGPEIVDARKFRLTELVSVFVLLVLLLAEQAYEDAKRGEDLAAAEAVLGPQRDDDVYDQIEKEREQLKKKGGLTPVTYDSFVAWKARKAEEKKKNELADAYKKLEAARSIKGKSGRDLFNHLLATNADLFLDDDEVDDDWMVRDHGSDDEGDVYDIEVTGTTFALKKAEKSTGAAAGNAQADGEAAAEELTAAVDASLFLDEDVELPSDEDD
jgi:hypothetical protein